MQSNRLYLFTLFLPKVKTTDCCSIAGFDPTKWDATGHSDSTDDFKLLFTPLPMYHGGQFICMGFSIGEPKSLHSSQKGTWMVYLSDLTALVPETKEFLLQNGPGLIDILVIDCLYLSREPFSVHLNLPQALSIVRQLRPKQTYFVGLSHDFSHWEWNERLKRYKDTEGLCIELARDGLSLPMQLP